MSAPEIEALRNDLEPGDATRLLPQARYLVVSECISEVNRHLYGADGEELSPNVLAARNERCATEAAKSLIVLGKDHDDLGQPRFWFAFGDRVFSGWLELGLPPCDDRTKHRCGAR